MMRWNSSGEVEKIGVLPPAPALTRMVSMPPRKAVADSVTRSTSAATVASPAAYPRIELHISTSLAPADFAGDRVDVDIRFGQPASAGLRVDPFLSSARFPVASPRLLNGRRSRRSPDDLRHFTLLHNEVEDGWQQWLECAGVTGLDASPGPRFEHCNLTLRAALEGQGVALAYGALAEADLAMGLLIKLFDISLPPTVIYSVVTPQAWSTRPKIAAFRSWLLRAARVNRAPAAVPPRLAAGTVL